jgi:hypothetical protein
LVRRKRPNKVQIEHMLIDSPKLKVYFVSIKLVNKLEVLD